MIEAEILKTVLTITHLIGLALGAGGAFATDALFVSIFKDKKINNTEMRLAKVGSSMVWLGVLILLVSGYLLFSLNTERYLASPKFLAKMTIVAAIIINGLYLHLKLLPHCARHVGRDLTHDKAFLRHRGALFTSGAISFVSWMGAIILGSLRGLPMNYLTIMAIYGVFLIIAIVGAHIIGPRIIPDHT